MELTLEEKQILDGNYGEPKKKALEYQMEIGKYYNAERFVSITQSHITADYEVMGEAGLAYLEEQCSENAEFVVSASTNARCVDFESALSIGQSGEVLEKEYRVIKAVRKLGASTIDSCINYQVSSQPRMGEHVAWGDTGTVIYANSVFGSRTNYESGPAVFAASITGRVPEYGFHLDEYRKGTIVVDVQAEMNDLADWGILGRIVGSKVFDYREVPVLTNVSQYTPTSDDLKHLGASMATWSIGMFHAVGVTPEARTLEDATGGKKDMKVITITEEDMRMEYESFEYKDNNVSLIALSGPQLSLEEIRRVAKLLDGKKIHPNVDFIITVAAATYVQSTQAGYTDIIEKAGGKFLKGVCFYILDGLSEIRKKNNWSTLVTNSVKLANNVKAHRFVPVVRKTDECIEIAIRGVVK